jgi:hypothetical protein
VKIPTRKELQARHAKAVRICKALDIAIDELACVASAPSCVVNPAYSKGALKALKKIEKLIKPKK